MDTLQSPLTLRDIHLPDPISWYILAPGWWLLLGLCVLLIMSIVWLWLKKINKRKEPKYIALRYLENLQTEYQQQRNIQTFVQKLSILLRRLSVSYYSREEVASLTGEAWLIFLDGQIGEPQFTEGQGRCLIQAPYSTQIEVDVPALIALCQKLIIAFPTKY